MVLLIDQSDKMAFTVNDKKKSNTQLKNLVKEGRNRKVKSILKKTSLLDQVDEKGMTVLHFAAKSNNLDMIKYLKDMKCDLDVKSSTNMTPLLLAVLYNQFDAAKLLLDCGANMLIRNSSNKYPLQIILNKQRKTPDHVVKHFLDILKTNIEDNVLVADILIRAGCTLSTCVFLLNDSQLTRAFLDNPYFIDDEGDEIIPLIMYTMKIDCEHLRVILQHGTASLMRQREFFHNVLNRLNFDRDYDWLSRKQFVIQLAEWEIMTDGFFNCWVKLLQKLNNRMTNNLLESVVHLTNDNKYRQCLIAHAFGKLDYDVIISALGSNKIDVNSCGEDKLSCLHFAVMKCRKKNINFLLRKGANSNARDTKGKTPLFYTSDPKCIELLFNYGADVQSIDNEGLSVLESMYYYEQLEIITVQFVIVEACGEPINPIFYNAVKSSSRYDKCRQQMNESKEIFLLNSLTMYDVLVNKPEHLVRYVQDEKTVAEIEKRCMFYNYAFKIKRNLQESLARYKTMSSIAEVIFHTTGELVSFDHLAVVKIVSFYDFKTL